MGVTAGLEPTFGQWLMGIEQWWLRAGVFLLPLAYTWNTYDRYVLPKLLLARMLIIGLLILFVIRSIVRRNVTIRPTPLDLPIVVFILSAAVSTPVAFNQNVAIFGTYSRYDGLLTIVTYAALFWLTVQALGDRNEARMLVRVLLASGYLVAAVAIVQSVLDSAGQHTFVAAFGTLGQKNDLGMFLAMSAPLAFREVVDADSRSNRVIALNAFAVIVVGLLLSLSRSAWLGATVAAVVLVFSRYRPNLRLLIAGWSIVVVVGVLIAGLSIIARHQPEPRLVIWRDTLSLIASRPVLGYGPDNFGLVYPRFQSKELGTQQVDKAHAEVLQVAATQGLVGLAAYALILVAFVRAFLGGRAPTLPYPASGGGKEAAACAGGGGKLPTVAIFAALIAYQVTLQLNFTALAATLPFWVLAAIAMESWGATRTTRLVVFKPRRWIAIAAALPIAALLALTIGGVVRPYLADTRLLAAVQADLAGRPDAAHRAAAEARGLAPQESVYAVEVANIAFEKGDWARSADAYLDAAALGTYNPLVYRNLALADRNLGRITEALAAARKAVELDRFDPANRALLAQLEALNRNQTGEKCALWA